MTRERLKNLALILIERDLPASADYSEMMQGFQILKFVKSFKLKKNILDLNINVLIVVSFFSSEVFYFYLLSF